MKSAGTFTIGTLDGRLNRAQTQYVIDKLKAKHPKSIIDMVTISDADTNKARKQGVFCAHSPAEVAMLLQKLQEGEFQLLDIFAEDLLHAVPEGLELAAVPNRNRPYDALLHKEGVIIDDLPEGSRIGVLSIRSQSQISALWPHLKPVLLYGGAVTALNAYLQSDQVDCVVLPASVAERLGVQDLVSEIFFPEIMLPGAGQGLIAILARKGDTEVIEMARSIHSNASGQEMLGELAFRERICSDQNCPMGVLAQVAENKIVITGAIGSTNHASFNQAVLQGPAEDALHLGQALAERLLMNTTSLIDLLEADFPEGLPLDGDDDDPDALLETDLEDDVLDEDDLDEDDF